jgi:hypothetical protein
MEDAKKQELVIKQVDDAIGCFPPKVLSTIVWEYAKPQGKKRHHLL